MSSEIHCTSCNDLRRESCTRNFKETRAAVDDGVEESMQSEWKEVAFSEAGDLILTPLAPYTEVALRANSILRNIFLNGLIYTQAELGCTLGEVDIEKKLVTI